ncbi:hypothetical protein [Sorangium sp. So ce124]|uniref:hypothetical protein n=1 Tax=Sorangium sp. So ce124 TaxID=3133280 RepID=UPI003F602B17
MILDREHWERHCAGYTVYDCAIMDAARTFYVMVESTDSPHRDPLPRTRFLFARADRPLDQKRFVRSELGDFGFTEIAYGPSAIEFVAVDTGRQVFSYDRSRAGQEADIPGELPSTTLLAATSKIARVGQSMYAVGWPRRVYLRAGLSSWAPLDSGMPLPKKLSSSHEDDRIEAQTNYTFNDLAGFSETDMYVVGDAGEVWRFDGARWGRCAFPTNQRLCTVACGADGKVYVTTQTGSIWVGRGDAWKLLVDVERSVPFRDSAWFGGKLWCGSDYGLWTVEGDELTTAELPAEVFLASGRIDVSPDGGHLLTAGAHGAALFDGARWELLFSSHEFA